MNNNENNGKQVDLEDVIIRRQKEEQLRLANKVNYWWIISALLWFFFFTYVMLFYSDDKTKATCLKDMKEYKRIEVDDKCRQHYFDQFLWNKNREQIDEEDFEWIQVYFKEWLSIREITYYWFCSLESKWWVYKWNNKTCKELRLKM